VLISVYGVILLKILSTGFTPHFQQDGFSSKENTVLMLQDAFSSNTFLRNINTSLKLYKLCAKTGQLATHVGSMLTGRILTELKTTSFYKPTGGGIV
jgi:hypothetical protein